MEINEKKNESTKQKPLDKNRHKSYQTKRKKGYKADTVKSARDTEENACKQESCLIPQSSSIPDAIKPRCLNRAGY